MIDRWTNVDYPNQPQKRNTRTDAISVFDGKDNATQTLYAPNHIQSKETATRKWDCEPDNKSSYVAPSNKSENLYIRRMPLHQYQTHWPVSETRLKRRTTTKQPKPCQTNYLLPNQIQKERPKNRGKGYELDLEHNWKSLKSHCEDMENRKANRGEKQAKPDASHRQKLGRNTNKHRHLHSEQGQICLKLQPTTKEATILTKTLTQSLLKP